MTCSHRQKGRFTIRHLQWEQAWRTRMVEFPTVYKKDKLILREGAFSTITVYLIGIV